MNDRRASLPAASYTHCRDKAQGEQFSLDI
jgi:hypothetical protein